MRALKKWNAVTTHVTSNGESALTLAAAISTSNTQAVLDTIMGSPPFDNITLKLAGNKLTDELNVLHIACSSGNSVATAFFLSTACATWKTSPQTGIRL